MGYGFSAAARIDFSVSERRPCGGLIDEMTRTWEPTKYHDSYRDNIAALIAAKCDGVPVEYPERKPVVSTGDDLMATLRASIEIEKAKKRA